MESHLTRRRWFRFSLRTMLVLVTVVCIYLGWAMNWIKQRHEFLESLSGAYVDRRETIAPWPLQLIGEPGVFAIRYRKDRGAEIQLARRLFPEARVELELIRVLPVEPDPPGSQF